jgi:hypothetical protein
MALLAVPASAATVTVHSNEGDEYHLAGGLFDTSVHQRHNLLSAFIDIPWGSAYGFPIGVEARFYIPLVKEGFIPTLNDEFGLEFGVGFGAGFASFGVSWGFDIPVHVLWGFHLTPDWMVYATLGIAGHIWFWPGIFGGGSAFYGSPIWPEGGVGAIWDVAPGWKLRFEAGYGLFAGVTWPI